MNLYIINDMSKKDKFLIVLLTIVTLGFCWLYWHVQNKKEQKLKKGEINKLDSNIKLDELVELLGSKENINSVNATFSNLKVEFNDKKAVNVDELQKLKYVSGVMISSTKMTLVVGDYAKKIAEELNKKLELVSE